MTSQKHPDDTHTATELPPTAASDSGQVSDRPIGPLPLIEVPTEYYVLEGEQGRGGIGVVMKARDRRLDRVVALKQLQSLELAARLRFEREMRITARLQHPGVVPVHETGRFASGEPFYAMKLVQGRSLKEVIAERRSLDERIALLPNILAVAETIAYAHSKRIIHRDLKPSNVIIGDYGETVVIDWGLAKDMAEAPDMDAGFGPYRELGSSSHLTMHGAVLGTPAYMAPEQAKGAAVAESADVYALGALLFHVLTGKAPFEGKDSADIIASVIGSRRPDPTHLVEGIPPELAAVVALSMAYQAEERYPTAQALVDDLRRFQAGQLVRAHRYSRRALVLRWARRHRTALLVAGVAIATLMALGALSIQRIIAASREAERQKHVAEAERDAAKQTRDDGIIAQAAQSLAHDPTAAVAWIKTYPSDGSRMPEALAIAREARALGVARFVAEEPSGLIVGAMFMGSSHYAITLARDSVDVWDTSKGSIVARKARSFSLGGVAGAVAAPLALVPIGEKSLAIIDARGAQPEFHDLDTPQPVESYAISADGAAIAYRLSDGSLWIARLSTSYPATPSKIAQLPAPVKSQGYAIVRLSNDASSVLIARTTGELLALDATTGKVLASRNTKMAIAGMTAQSLDGSIYISAADGASYTANVFPAAFGRPSRVIGTRAYSTYSGFLIPQPAGNTQIWRLSGEAATTAPVDVGRASAFCATPDMSTIAAAMPSGEVILWSASDPRRAVLLGHTSQVEAIDIRADGRSLLTTSRDGQVRIWDIQRTGIRVLTKYPQQAYGIVGIGTHVISSGCDGSVRVNELNATAEERIPIASGGCPIVDVSHDGKHFAAATEWGLIYEVALEELTPRLLVSSANGDSVVDMVEHLKYSNSDQWLAGAFGSSHRVALMHEGQPSPAYLQMDARVVALAFADNDDQLYVGLDNKTIVTVSLPSLSMHVDAVGSITARIAPAGDRILVGTVDGDVIELDRDGLGSQGTTLARHPSRVHQLIVRGDAVLTSYRDGYVSLVDRSGGNRPRLTRMCREAMGIMRWDADRPIIISCRDGLLKFVNPVSFQTDVVKTADDAVSLYSLDGVALVGDMEGNVSLWNVPSNKALDGLAQDDLNGISHATVGQF